MRKIWLVAKTVLTEATRRKEIYAVVLISVAIILLAGSIRFFDIEQMTRFYRDMAFKTMHVATALTVIFLSARQLPREFEYRTIYPLLAQPIGRFMFLMGKFVGVLLSGMFCYGLFMVLFVGGLYWLGDHPNWMLLLQAIYLQWIGLAVIAALAYMLSLLFNLDAAITVATLMYILANAYTSIIAILYQALSPFGKTVMLVLNFAIPQLTLFDMSSKVVHEAVWPPVSWWVITTLTIYGGAFTCVYLAITYLLFRRRPI